jgi:plastocyanin
VRSHRHRTLRDSFGRFRRLKGLLSPIVAVGIVLFSNVVLVGCGGSDTSGGAAAKAQTYTVLLGVPPGISKEGEIGISEFFPKVLRVHPGDTVIWRNVSLSAHYTVTFGTDREAIPSLYRVRDPGKFSTARVILNNAVLWPCVDASALVNPQLTECKYRPDGAVNRSVRTWNGEGYANSGIIPRYFHNPLNEANPQQFVLHLSPKMQSRTYRYFAEIERHMDGELKVEPSSVPIPSPDEVSKNAPVAMADAVQGVLTACKQQLTHLEHEGHYRFVAGCGDEEGSYNDFFPDRLVIPRTASIEVKNNSDPVGEYHSVTFAPIYAFIGAPFGAIPYFVPICGRKEVQLPLTSVRCPDGRLVSAELNPAASFATAKSGGKYKTGSYNSSGLFPAPYPATPGTTYSLKFNNPGTYFFGCVLHPGMSGEVVVKS